MRVGAGRFKGRNIPFVNSRYGDADITMQMVKEAGFDIIGRRIEGSSFLDLFSCSGQVALEALSRGASCAVMNEHDRKRVEWLRRLKKDFSLGDEAEVVCLTWQRCFAAYAEKGRSFDILYCDPPYVKERKPVPLYGDILAAAGESGIVADGGIIIMQHHFGNVLDAEAGGFFRYDERKYGQTGLSFYRRKEA